MGKSNFTPRLLAAGVAGAIALSATTPGWSAPVMSGAVLKMAVQGATEVQWRPRYGWAIAGAAAAGVVAGAALARPYRYYYGPPPAYVGPPPPVAYVVPPPVVYGPRPLYYSYRNQSDPAGCGPGTHTC